MSADFPLIPPASATDCHFSDHVVGRRRGPWLDGPVNRTWGLLAVASLALTGCGGADAASSSTETKDQPSSAAPTKSAVPLTGESICTDAVGDSASTAIDLEEIRLISDGQLMFLTFSAGADLPATGTVLFSATVWSDDGNTGYQMGTKFQNGQEIGNFVYDMTTSQQKNITNGAVAADKQVSVRYPLAELEGLGESFTWSGAVSVEGTDVDRCPDGDGKTSFPDA